jgi:hypothetical protein
MTPWHAIRVRQPGQDSDASDDHRRLTDESSNLDHAVYDGRHRIAREGDATTRHQSTVRLAFRRPGVKDFSTSADVLVKIKSDEQWVR